MGNKEKIYELIKENEAGITYTDLEKKFKERYGKELKSGYVYLSELIKEGKIEPVRTAKVEGRKVVYRLKGIAKENNVILNTKLLSGYKQFNTLFIKLTENSKELFPENRINKFKQLVRENINIENIKELNSELIK